MMRSNLRRGRYIRTKKRSKKPVKKRNKANLMGQHRAQDVYQDLDNFIPVGTVTRKIVVEEDGDVIEWPIRNNDEWQEVDPSHGHSYLDHPSEPKVEHLLRPEKLGGSIRVFGRRHPQDDLTVTFRVYVFPDDVGRRFVDMKARTHQRRLADLFPLLDKSSASWEGHQNPAGLTQCKTEEQYHDDSLFYLFNTLPLPSPSPTDVSCPIAKVAVQSLLDTQRMPGLKTSLYPYQKRSAAEMVKRETSPLLRADPRFEIMEGPTGRRFYYDGCAGVLLRDKREHEDVRGGILAETMGLGKTLICLAAILATKGHWPRIPPQYSTDFCPVRPTVGSLTQMAAAAINHQGLPWRTYFQDLSGAGEHYGRCIAVLEENIGSYIIPAQFTRGRDQKKFAAGQDQRVCLCSATLVIVPENLFLQWKNEIGLHLKEGALKVLYMELSTTELPSRADLLSYDIVLMTKKRFNLEFLKEKTLGSKIFRSKPPYHTPLKDLHWLRVIADEGHAFASSGHKSSIVWALEGLHFERRWIVSGTPAAGVLGVEVDLASNEFSQEQSADSNVSSQSALAARQKVTSGNQEIKDLENLGSIVAHFLRARPWANSRDEGSASWRTYFMPRSDGRRKAKSFRSVLEGLVVRHQIEAVEDDVQLPPLYNKVVYLQPSWHDKLSINLFVLSLTANAVTSERVDQDYMFHPRNRVQLEQLIKNLRQSGFYWTGFSSEDIRKTLEISGDYLSNMPVNPCQPNTEDRVLLTQAMESGRLALDSPSWKALTELNELGIYIEAFPDDACNAWSLVQRNKEGLLLVGITQLIEAQKYVDSRLYFPDPATGLGTFGITTMEKLWLSAASKGPKEPKLTKKNTKSEAKAAPEPRKNPHAQNEQAMSKTDLASTKSTLKSAMKASATIDTVEPLGPESALANAKISATASAKLSYLLDRVIVLEQEEKILIFYEADQIAYYVAQALELMNIEHRIYTGTSLDNQGNDYIDTFNTNESCRVLLMNIRRGAHGLHLANASRVFFVNPVWQPNIEAQAIKRAHRIGQNRPVYVETLVLKDSLEDKMLQRRKQMTTEEHQIAQKSILDDPVIRELIQGARPIPFSQDENLEVGKQMAFLEIPQRLFGRAFKTTSVQSDSDAGRALLGKTNTTNTEQQSLNGKVVGLDPSTAQSLRPLSGKTINLNAEQQSQKRKAVGFDPESSSSRQKLKDSTILMESEDMATSSDEEDDGNMRPYSAYDSSSPRKILRTSYQNLAAYGEE